MSKKTIEVKLDEKNPEAKPSVSKAEFKALIEAYAKQNPVKYAVKKAALEKQLNSL